jgi:site-specific DNA-methyltransferase (adenine-specific)
MQEMLNKIILGDCLDVMRTMPDKCVDLVLTDPPYGINIAKTGKVGRERLAKAKDYGAKDWDSFIPNKEYFDEVIRISKNQIIFGGNYFVECLTNSSCWLVWNKLNSGNYADCELAWTSFKTAVRKYDFMWNGMLQENMKDKEIRIHPTQKPVGLFSKIIRDYSNENDIIFDPFIGSGTTAVACIANNRQWFGCELDPEYHRLATERVEKEKLNLFNVGG